jgi:hypothetical protein
MLSFTIVLGTPVTRNFLERSMNSVASTEVAVMCLLLNAILCARTTALGQCGQVGVENTLMSIGALTEASLVSESGSSSTLPVPASSTASTSGTNS